MSAQPLLQILRAGGSLRYRPPNGFYAVLSGKAIPVHQAEAQAAVKAQQVRPAGIDPHGVYLFTLNNKAANVRRVPDHPQALPKRPAAVPPALPDVHPVRCKADSKTPAAIPADAGAAQGQVQGGAGGLDGAGAQRAGAKGAGKANGMGSGAKGVTA